MCLGKTHATSGIAAGLAAGEFVLHLKLPGTLTLGALTGCWATWPDLDQRGSCAGRSLGFASEAAAWCIGKLSGGHRHLTHAIVGIAGFTLLAALACHWRGDDTGKAALAAFLLLALAAGLGAMRVGGHAADILAACLAAGMAWRGWGLGLVPLACGLGCAVHVLGDLCTDSGVMLAYPWSHRRFHLLPEPFAWTTGTNPERYIVMPLLVLALIPLAALAIDPAAGPLVWTHLAHYV